VASGQLAQRRRRAGRGRPPLHDNQRDRVIACAAELFARDGFENVPLDQIAEALGISKAGIYHYFRAKQEILEAIVVSALDGLTDAVLAATAQAAGPRERLIAFMTAHADYFEANYWAFMTMLVGFGGIRSPVRRGAVVGRRDRYEGLLRQIVADGIASGDFRPMDVATVSRAVLSLLNWMARWFDPEGSERASELAQRYVELLLDGIGARRTTSRTAPAKPPGNA
jgi:TetR/AcrR family transcriptional regulator, cholesterol catabolism regulator